MLTFSQDPAVAERQMAAIIFYLTTFGYIDGDFDLSEKDFVRDYIRKVIVHRVELAKPDAEQPLKDELSSKWATHFLEVFDETDQYVRELFTEAVANEEKQNDFVYAKLKLRCFEIFQGFDKDNQEKLMETIDELIMADGQAHPAELKFRAELAELLEADLDVELVETLEDDTHFSIGDVMELELRDEEHPFFERFEYHYSRDPGTIAKQVSGDLTLIDELGSILERKRLAGNGRLDGKQSVAAFDGEEPLLDGHVHVLPLQEGREYDVTVLGDLHGCYSCLKAAVMQSRFFEKVNAYRKAPDANPDPKLVLLGDYIDRGMFSYNGVLRTVMQLVVTAPEHVYMLRGNHEYYLEYEGRVYGGVKPAEAINSLKPHLPVDVFKRYMGMFDALPSVLLLGRTLFVHGGIPRDLLVKERWQDLSSLNDKDIRFQMMWSDPSTVDVVPAELQEQSARFAFGRLQCQAFLQRLGCNTLVRGHEKLNEGYKCVYDDPGVKLISLFSAGGKDNDDLPAESSYRQVTPMALSMRVTTQETQVTPWVIDYAAYNDPDRNAFFKAAPEIAHRVE